MFERNQFTSLDILALTNFTSARTLMDATLWGPVSNAIASKLGRISRPKRAMTQLFDHQRYVVYSAFGASWDFGCFFGYWFTDETPADYPWVGTMIYVNPRSVVRENIVRAMREFLLLKKGTWNDENLDDDQHWSAIYCGSELRNFLSASDHVEAIKSFFLELLGDVEEFRVRNPSLPWTMDAPDEAD